MLCSSSGLWISEPRPDFFFFFSLEKQVPSARSLDLTVVGPCLHVLIYTSSTVFIIANLVVEVSLCG